MNKIKYVLSSASIPWILDNDKKTKVAKKRGFDGIELILTRRALRQLGRKMPEGVCSFHEPFGEGKTSLLHSLIFLDLTPFEAPWNYYRYLNLAEKYNLPIVCHVNGPFFNGLEGIMRKDRKEMVALEFNTFNVAYNRKFSPEDLLAMAKDYDCGICLDVGYAHQAGWNIVLAFETLREKVQSIHFYDIRKHDPHFSMDKNLCPGKGILPLERFLLTLKESGWCGQITFELLPQPMVSHKEALSFVKRILADYDDQSER